MKTIITSVLAAASILGASAMAEDATTTAYFGTGSATSQSSGNTALSWDTSVLADTLTAYTLTFDIDLSNLVTSAGTGTSSSNFIRYANSTSTGNINIAVVADGSAGTLTLYICNGAYGASSVLNSVSVSEEDTLTITVTGNTLTVTTSAEDTASVDVSNYDVSITSGSSEASGQNLRFYSFSGGTAQYSNASITGAAAAVVVPEPATATLSLLALAGLAARRRRK